MVRLLAGATSGGCDGATRERLAQFDFAYWQQQTSEAVETLLRCGDLTPLGERFVGQIAETLRSWHDETVATTIGDAVHDAVDTSAFTWSFRNLRRSAEPQRPTDEERGERDKLFAELRHLRAAAADEIDQSAVANVTRRGRAGLPPNALQRERETPPRKPPLAIRKA